MAKSPKAAPEQEGEIAVSMVQFKMKGSDASLQKGLDTIKAALVQAGFAPPAIHETRQLRSQGPRPLIGNGQDAESEVIEEVPAGSGESEAEEALEVASRAPKKPAAPKKAPNFKIIKELKFDDVSPTLADFVTQKKPDSHLDRYLCIAFWFKHNKGLDDLTTEHFFTAYMTYQWPLPGNAQGPINDLRHTKRQWFAVGATQGTSTITNAGERRVIEMGKATEG